MRFSVIRRFLCKRVFGYSDRPNAARRERRPDYGHPAGYAPVRDLSPGQRGFPCDRALYPSARVSADGSISGAHVNPRIRTQTGALALNNGFCFARNAVSHEKKALAATDTSGTLDFPRNVVSLGYTFLFGIFFRIIADKISF